MFLSQLPSLLPSSDSVLLIKIALTNDQCGALIGKGGGVITTLQRSCGVLIKAGSVGKCNEKNGIGYHLNNSALVS